MNPEENQNLEPEVTESNAVATDLPVEEEVPAEEPVPVTEIAPETTPVEVQPEIPVVEKATKSGEPKEDLSAVAEQSEAKEEAPVSFDWKKPIVWMVVIGVAALGIWLVANTI